MKKSRWVIVLLALALVLSMSLMAACGDDEETTTTAAPATTAPPTTGAPTTAPPTTVAPTTTTAAGVPDTGQTYELKMAVHVPERASIVGAYYNPWIAAVDAATQGRVKIKLYAEETLVKEADQYDAVVSGLADLASCTADATPGRFPLAEFYALPLFFPSAEVAGKVYWDILNEFCAEEYKDVVIVGTPTIAAANLFSSKPVKVPADLAGQRVRLGGTIEGWVIEALGGTPVDIPTGELATSMERGVADSCFLSWSFGLITGVKDTTKYRTELNMFYRSFALVMNKDVWASMPKVLQDGIMSVSNGEATAAFNAANEALAAEDKGAIEGAGKGAGLDPIYVPTAEEFGLWKTACMPVWDRWVKEVGGDAQALLDKAKQLTEKYGAMAPTEVTTTTAPAGTTGIFFEDLGNKTVKVVIVPEPGQKFEVSTEGPFGAKVEAFDATGKSLGPLAIPESAAGVLDYSSVAGIAKIVATDVAHGGAQYEYMVP
jgi:TRAP-type C4-dicarboxylate transport system substrate-binding protein